MKVGIGTVQFGMAYGAFNRHGRTTIDEVSSILREAMKWGVSIIDTAPAYGSSEDVLGQCLPDPHPFFIVTKTPVFQTTVITEEQAQQLKATLMRSLEKLGQSSIYGLLIHHADDLLAEGGQHLYEALQELKYKGLVQKIGVSLYTARQIEVIFSHYQMDLVQVPVNMLDQRLIQGGYLKRLKMCGVEVHARSAFLQGLLLTPPEQLPPYFYRIRHHLREYHRFLQSQGLSSEQAALAFLANLPEIDTIIVGVETAEQMKQNLASVQKHLPTVDWAQFAIDDPEMVDPRYWLSPFPNAEESS
ncbi:aldo/keto reductase [Brevibacillus humidisoli]|uniref:aldo/keto reductase n=1 Tax=Brevibacillus humidisoli TaxID=2895522 RepID=UPI001E2FC931|nr:aldo/keto reductase [Brevibacillus humidisoli]UFJ42525.1 aldo/keto reductase [Brevibacillus humidisoli]